MFAAEAIAEMISAEPADCSLATADHYRARLRQVAVDLCGGSIYKLTKELNFSKGVLNRSGGISLTQFLAVIHRLGVGPIAFLKATAEPFIDPDAVGTRHVRYSKASVKDLGVVERRLTELVARLAKQPDTPVPVESLARKLEVPTRTLRLKFPEALAVLRKHNEEARPAARLVKLESQKVAACAAMRDLVARCGSTRGRSIQAALAEAGVPWVTPELRAFARTELHKLLALSR
jgi:hypothetical protein